jgi:hypothetical protein
MTKTKELLGVMVALVAMSGCAAETGEAGDVPEIEDLPVAGQTIYQAGCSFTAQTPQVNSTNTQVRGVLTYTCAPGQPSISYRVDIGNGSTLYANNQYTTLAYSGTSYSGTRYSPWINFGSGVTYRSRAAANHVVTEWSTGYVRR